MSAAERFATHPPARLEWHPAHGETRRGDPETFLLHVEFVHAHGLPKGEFTTFSHRAPDDAGPPDPERRDGARGQVSGCHVAARRKHLIQAVADSPASLARGSAAIRDCG